jgi:hypothetical protein
MMLCMRSIVEGRVLQAEYYADHINDLAAAAVTNW